MAKLRRGSVLGHGSSATVTLVSSSSGELYAVKSAELSKSNLLQNEQSILSTLDCPQIITCLGFEVTHLHYNLFLEYAPGGSLSDHNKNHGGRFDEHTIRSHTHDILTGLSYLHSRGIVHCDIKPQNILVGSDGRAKIADLGCARWLDEATYQVKGTPMFMAPEVARGEEQGPAADVWALGCTVLEMVTGCRPWLDADPITALHRIAFSTAVPEIPSWVSDEGADFMKRCLLRDPSQRWTVNQLLEHPFAKLCSTKDNQDRSTTSITPQSMLDCNMWEIFSQEDEENDETFDDSKDRIRELEGSCSARPDWSWDESWVTIRNTNRECLMTSMAADDDDKEVTILPSHPSSIRSGSRQDFGSLFYDTCDYLLLDDNSNEILEYCNGREMQRQCSCKRDLLWLLVNSLIRLVICWHCPNICFNFLLVCDDDSLFLFYSQSDF